MLSESDKTNLNLNWRRHLFFLTPILIIYFVLAFYRIDYQSIWEDEYWSLNRIHSSIPIWKDGHGFLYFALLQGWINIGSSAFVLRTLSVLLGAVAVCLIYLFSSTNYNRQISVIGTTLFATSPLLIWYSQEIRYITLVLVTTLLMMFTFQRAVLLNRNWWWLAYGVSTILALFSFLSTLLLPFVHGFYILGSSSRRLLLRKWIVCQVLIFVIFGWWFVNGTHYWPVLKGITIGDQNLLSYETTGIPTGEFNNVNPAVVPWTFFTLSVGLSLGPSSNELHADRFAALKPHIPLLSVLAIFYGILVIAGSIVFWRKWDSALLIFLWIGVPIFGAFGIAAIANLFYDIRYVTMVLPAYMLIVAAGIARFRKPLVQVTLLGAVLGIHALSLANYYTNPRYAREDTRSAAHYLESKVQTNDLILLIGTKSSMPYYYKGSTPIMDWDELPGPAYPLSERFRKIGKDYKRLWLVNIRPWQSDPTGKVNARLGEDYKILERKHFSGVEIFCYQLTG